MSFLKPTPPPYDPLEWQKMPFAKRARLVCEAWAIQGYGAPVGVLFVYILKAILFAAGWAFFCSLTPGLGSLSTIDEWWLEPLAFQKAIVWSMFFENLGLGCGSGPLTGRYYPPIGGFLYFLRPGTTKLPLFPSLLGTRRTWLDVGLYAFHNVWLVYLLVAPAIDRNTILPTIVMLAILGILDKTIFLAARAEHYWTTAVCFAFSSDWIAGAKAVQLALWFWAGVSKLNHHFPAVVAVVTSNSPVFRFPWIRKKMYKNYPTDLRPSWIARVSAHWGGALEFLVPIVLGLSHGGAGTTIGLILMLMLHIYITTSVPMGVPIEWNVLLVYAAFFLFWKNAGVAVLSISSPLLLAFLVVMLILIPLIGNLFPQLVSFLFAMRYYAGNWAYSIWLFRGDSYRRLDKGLVKSSGWIYDQLSKFYDYPTSVGLVGKVLGFRSMHLHGRAIQKLLPKAVEHIEEYEYVDGELIAGIVLGYNFGDGHLHREELLQAIQKQCGFEPGELRCLFVESQPLFRPKMQYRIYDASTGLIEKGHVVVRELREMQPYPTS